MAGGTGGQGLLDGLGGRGWGGDSQTGEEGDDVLELHGGSEEGEALPNCNRAAADEDEMLLGQTGLMERPLL